MDINVKQYIFPIYSGGTIVGQGFVADGYFITAAHVVKDFPSCFTRINGKRIGFSNFYPDKHLAFIGEGDIYHDSSMMDVAIYPCGEIESPLHLSENIPQKGETLESYCMHEVMDFSRLNPPCELRMKPAFAKGQEDGNYYYCDCEQYGGSSGSPLLMGKDVVGIMHGGNNQGLCAFLKAQVVFNIISQIELNLDYNDCDFDDARECDGCTYSKNGKRLLKGKGDTIQQGTITICNEAFYKEGYSGWSDGKAFGNIIIPNSVKYIGEKAFACSKELESIEIPDSVALIGKEAFWGCTFLKSVVLSNSITHIADGLFEGCQSLSEIIISNSVTEIGKSAFSGCDSISEIKIPDSVTHIGDWAFEDCTELTEIYMPDTIDGIGEGVFDGCDSLSQIFIPVGTIEKFKKLLPEYENLLFEKAPEVEKTWEPFGEAYNLKDIWEAQFPEKDLYGEIDGDTAEVVAVEFADGNIALRLEIPFKDGSNVRLKLANVSDYDEGDKVIISTIAGQEFHKEGYAPIIRYSGVIFSTDASKDDLANAWTDEFGVKYSQDRVRLLKAPDNLQRYKVRNGTIIICDKAFSQCKELQSVKIPDSVIAIGDFAFYDCGRLSSANISKNVTHLGMCVFKGCERMPNYHPFE